MKIDLDKLIADPKEKISLKKYDPAYVGQFKKKSAVKELKKNVKELAGIQEVFYADSRYSLLIVLQAPDAAGKDGAIRHVMSGVNPQGCRVNSFRKPSKIELGHDYIWRHYRALPERGMVEIFNRSHYENILVTKVNPQFIQGEMIPGIDSVKKVNKKFWAERYRQINNFEKHLWQNGTEIVKIFLNLSKDEQKRRFLARIDIADKNWKFNSGDLEVRQKWDEYQKAYEDMLTHTSTDHAPWYIVPADNKWFSRIAIGKIIVKKLNSLKLQFPEGEGRESLEKARKILLSED